MSGRPILQISRKLPLSRRSIASQRRQYAHVRPTGKPTFVKGQHEDGSLLPIFIGVGAAITATFAVGALIFGSVTQTTTVGLRPDQYGQFDVLSTRKTSSPSQFDTSNDEHVFLRINAPLSREVIMEGLQKANPNQVRILSVFVKEPALQIERPYTPLYSDALDGLHPNTPIELLIKRYPDGELGRYAHRLSHQSGIELRGPTVTWQGSKPDHFILIVGGTGITPAFQLLNTIFSTSSQTLNTPTKSLPKFTILYGASKPSSFLLLPELATLQRDFPDLIDIRLQVDQLDNTTTQKLTWMDRIRGKSPQLEGMDVRVGRINAQSVRSALESSDKDKTASRRILVCGPDGMIAYVAGSKQGQQQGKLGGVLAGLDCQEEEVWKL